MKSTLLALALALSVPVGAQELSQFSCQRPDPVESGSATNAAIACELVNGQILKPGEVFSFNRCLTPGLDRFVEGTAYASGRVIKSEGGGVCQVSSALYNAALLAGLEVLERHNHSVYDPITAYVPAGRDAAISRSNGADLQFRNSTLAPLSITAVARGGLVEVHLMGFQRHPHRRWVLSQEVERTAHGSRTKHPEGLAAGEHRLKQKGFDGLRVKSQLCKAGPDGVTECASLGVDDYMMVTEILEAGPAAGSKTP